VDYRKKGTTGINATDLQKKAADTKALMTGGGMTVCAMLESGKSRQKRVEHPQYGEDTTDGDRAQPSPSLPKLRQPS
jgi:hypothetical protein